MRIALVTGAYKGLGFECCRQLGKQGYKVIMTARDLERAQESGEKLNRQELEVCPIALEITDENQREKKRDLGG